jgi:hypothetical protein
MGAISIVLVSVIAKARNMRNAHLNEARQPGVGNSKRHISVLFHFGPPRANAMFVSEGAE